MKPLTDEEKIRLLADCEFTTVQATHAANRADGGKTAFERERRKWHKLFVAFVGREPIVGELERILNY